MLSRRLLRIKVIKALYSHFKSESESLIISEKTLSLSIDKCYDLYFQMMWLVVDLARYADSRIKLGKNKKLPTEEDLAPNMRFVENRIVKQLENSEKLNRHLERKSLGWVKYPELIKNLYNSMVDADYYKEYMSKDTVSYKDDSKFVTDFFRITVDENEALYDVVEEQSILWADDTDFALIMTVKTIGDCRASQEDIPISPKFKSDEDMEFYKELFRKSLVNFKEYLEYVDKFTQNWDVERIAFMDNIIMVTAMAELINFPSIPVNVTMDEYIEIAKYYSTPGSSQFINGILDKTIEAMSKEGRINKIGRGLL